MITKLGKSKVLQCPVRCIFKPNKINISRVSFVNRPTTSELSCVRNVEALKIAKPIVVYSNVILRRYTTSEETLDKVRFESICAETLESLTEYFEELIENTPEFKNADVSYSDGVLTVHLGSHGTYVINRQSPNLQIWLSSPTSGPKRYDFTNGTWVYKHDKTTLHSLLDNEFEKIINRQVEFTKRCAFSILNNGDK